MAQVARTSPRHLTRLLLETAGIAPLQYLRRIRLAAAGAALRTGRHATRTPALAGSAQMRGCAGLYARTVEAMRTLADARDRSGSALRLRANVVLMRSTLDDFDALARQLADAGVDEISYNLLGGRDRPAFHALESVSPGALDCWLRDLPRLRRNLARMGVTLIGGLILSYLAALKIMGHDIGGRPLLWLGFFCVLGGLQFLTTGVLAELLIRIYYDRGEIAPYHTTPHAPLAEGQAWHTAP